MLQPRKTSVERVGVGWGGGAIQCIYFIFTAGTIFNNVAIGNRALAVVWVLGLLWTYGCSYVFLSTSRRNHHIVSHAGWAASGERVTC